MSEQHDDSCRDSQHTTDVHSYRTNDPHTAVPDWLPFAPGIGPEARNLIMASLVLEKRNGPPTRRQLALALGVDERSIYRWLKEIASAGALSTRRDKRRRVNVFHKPIPDRAITDRAITDRAITDRPIRYRDSNDRTHVRQQSHETAIPDQAISDPSVGVGVDQHVRKDSTINSRGPLKTELACWLKQSGMNAAREFDDLGLDYWTYRRFVEEKRGLGWEWRQIVSTLREAPLERDPLATPLEDRDILEKARQIDRASADDLAADDLAADDLAELDSTSRQLARRFEHDRQLAQLRGAGLLDERGKPV